MQPLAYISQSCYKKNLHKIFVFLLLSLPAFAGAQKIKSIHVNLYTDSLKKGTFNYISIDGLLTNGNYTPLDSTDIIFWASDGRFYGNTLFVDRDFKKDKILIRAILRSNPAVAKEFIMYIKRKEDDEKLKTQEELLEQFQRSRNKSLKKA